MLSVRLASLLSDLMDSLRLFLFPPSCRPFQKASANQAMEGVDEEEIDSAQCVVKLNVGYYLYELAWLVRVGWGAR